MNDKIIHKELSYVVNGCIFDVHNELGPGLREECYQKALEHCLRQAGVAFLAKPATRRELVYRGEAVDAFEADLVVADRVVLELKHHIEGFAAANFAQILCYLKLWNLSLGLLVNFALDRAMIERVPFEPKPERYSEDYEFIQERLAPGMRGRLGIIREAILEINRRIGLGYGESTYRKLLEVELSCRGLRCEADAEVSPIFRECFLPSSAISPLVVEGAIAVEVEAIHDAVSARAVRTMQSHLKMLNCECGLIACFGKRELLIRGVARCP